MLELIDKQKGPPGLFEFVVPETGYRIKEHTLQELYKKVKLHYAANRIPLPENYQELIEDRICQRLDGNWCRHSLRDSKTGRIRKSPCRPSLKQIIKGTISIAEILLAKIKGKEDQVFVSQEEADQRALICSRCPFNYATSTCSTCDAMAEVTKQAAKAKGTRKTKYDSNLHNCCICGCRTEAIVHIDKEILNACNSEKDMLQYPKWCWKRSNDFQTSQSELCLDHRSKILN